MSEGVDQRTVWDSARAGSPAPSLNYEGSPCGATGPWTFRCTRARRHSGQHVATAGGEVAAVWSGYDGRKPATTAADAYSQAAGMARVAALKYTLTGNQGPEWVRREVVLDLAERLAELARETP